MAIIHVLDETTINKIAAGEVVERPASVIKELVENSIDAGAHAIEVEIADGGTTYMRVQDDGCGMTEEDARLAVLRHATSKIASVEDLFEIASLGFRGEAIASIASVSKFSLITRTKDQELGTRITIEGGHLQDCIPYGAQPGTIMEVRDLFYNTPARRKFLKTVRTEGSKIQDIVGRLALSHPEIAFKCIVDGRITIMTPGNDVLKDTIAALYGFAVSEDIFPISYEGENISISGVVGKPTLLKSSRMWQTIIVNHRIIQDRAITKAIDNAYHALLPKTGFPLVVVHIAVPADQVDINVHPRKSEVRFHDEKPVFKAVYHALLQALTHPDLGVEAATDVPDQIATAVAYDKVFASKHAPYQVVREETNQFIESLQSGSYVPQRPVTYEQEQLHSSEFDTVPTVPKSYTKEDWDTLKALQTGKQHLQEANERVDMQSAIPSRITEQSGFLPLGQVASCYIVAKKGDDLYIIDQHAAHERVRYDTLCKSSEAIPMQTLLIPSIIPASDSEMVLVEEEQETLQELGFSVTLGGPTQIAIEGIPADFVEAKGEEMLRYVFTLLQDDQHPSQATLRHEMLAYASCRGAIKSGHRLNMYQMSVLVESLFHTDKPYVCPHGRPTIIKFTPDELGKLFLRS